MTIRTTILATLLLLAALPAAAQCTFTPVYDGAYRTTALDTAIDGNDLWVATSWGLALFDASVDPPRPVTTVAMPGTTSSVAAAGGYVYVGSGTKVFVMRADAGTPVVVGSVDAGGTVNDLLLIAQYVFAASSAGVVQIDVILPDRPAVVRTLSTTNVSAQSLARFEGTLYAADGDSTVEAYNVQVPSFPQKIGTFNSLVRSLWVSEASGRLFVSDGQQTEVFAGSGALMNRVGTLAAGGNAAVAGSGSVVFLAGDDRRLRAFEVSGTGSSKLFASESAPLGGTVNRYLELVGANGRLHGAAGDAGLTSFDARGFDAPFPLRGYAFGQMTSVVSLGASVVSSAAGGGLFKYALGASGELTPQTNWDIGTASVVRDGSASRVLTSAGTKVRLWDVSQNPPAELSSVTLSTSVASAALNGAGGVAVLADQTVWSLNFSAAQGVATKLDLGGAKPLFVERGATDLAFAEFGESGTTTIRYYAGGILTATPAIATIEGATTSGIGVSGTGLVAGLTFKGISVVNFGAGGSVATYPGTNSILARDVQMSGSALFILTESTLQHWDTATGALKREVALDTAGVTTHAAGGGSTSAVVATAEGLSTIQYATTSKAPSQLAAGAANRYYRDAVAGDRLLHLFDSRSVDIVTLDTSGMPGTPRKVPLSGSIVDIAPVGKSLYVLATSGAVTSYSAAGVAASSYQVNESADQRMVGMRAVAGALWVTVEAGCLSGACEMRTLVIDPRGPLVKSATLAGGAVAATAEGTRAWAAFNVPNEIRVYDVADPWHPAQLVQRASTGNPIAIARDAARGAVYVLGQRLYVYTDTQLADAGTLLDAYTSDPSGRVGYVDQQIHVTGNCALITGRAFSPLLFRINSAANWSPEPLPGSAAAAVRASVVTGGKAYLLSDYSLEIWSSTGATPVRRRPARQAN